MAGTTPPVVNTLQGEGKVGGVARAGLGLSSCYQDLDCPLGAVGALPGWETFGIGPRGEAAQCSDLSQVLEYMIGHQTVGVPPVG